MLRKSGHIILFLVLLIATTGMQVSKHFCNDVLISASVYTDAEGCCNGDCCRDNAEFYQLDEEFQCSGYQKIPCANEITLFVSVSELLPLTAEKESLPVFVPVNEPPPPNIHVLLSLKQSYLL